MKLRDCPSCKRPQTTKNTESLGRVEGILYFNCTSCGSTFVLISKKRAEKFK